MPKQPYRIDLRDQMHYGQAVTAPTLRIGAATTFNVRWPNLSDRLRTMASTDDGTNSWHINPQGLHRRQTHSTARGTSLDVDTRLWPRVKVFFRHNERTLTRDLNVNKESDMDAYEWLMQVGRERNLAVHGELMQAVYRWVLQASDVVTTNE